MKVLFTNHLPQRVGTLCQAIQPAKFINDIKDISAQYIPEQRLTNNMNFDIIVFAKQCNPNVLRWAKEKGMKTIWHACDGMFYNFRDNILNNKMYLDAIITTNDDYKQICRDIGFDNQLLQNIYHHHCNFNNDIAPFNDNVKKVGYIGCADQLHRQEDIRQHLKKFNCELVVRGDKDLRYTDLDIGIAYIDPDSDDYPNLAQKETSWNNRILTRPNTKFVNNIAYGVPSVLTNYTSYKMLPPHKL